MEKEDYNTIIKASVKKDIQAKVEFLRRVPFMAAASETTLRKLATVVAFKVFPAGQVIVPQGASVGILVLAWLARLLHEAEAHDPPPFA